MQAELGGEETQAEARARYLKEMMHIRNVTARQLSDMTGVSKRTLEKYMSGRTDTAVAHGLSVAWICHVLAINAYILGGVEEIKPGTAFKSDGKRIAVTAHDYPRQEYGLSRRNFGYAMDYNGIDAEALSERSGVPYRVVKDIIDHRSDLRVMKAQTVFKLCRAMVFHPAFLYGLRDLRGYEKYRKNMDKNRRINAIRDEVLAEAREELKRRIEQEGL